jgi:uncharacterized protein
VAARSPSSHRFLSEAPLSAFEPPVNWRPAAPYWRTCPNRSSLLPARNRLRACWRASDAMSAERATYLDSSAIVKLVVREPESAALRRYLRHRRPLISSVLARTEVARALLLLGPDVVAQGQEVLTRFGLARVNDSVLSAAGSMLPVNIRSLDAIHLATAQRLGADLARIVTYDERMSLAAQTLGLAVAAPS